jgi:hypothetical protein
MAMTNYPFEANFLQVMPAWPCTVACSEVYKAAAPPVPPPEE